MTIKHQLYRAILRSEKAYEYYKKQRKYHQALRIYKANQEVYSFLEKLYLTCEEELLNIVFEYIFHLEDWFEQFNELRNKRPSLSEEFVFERLEFGISYPQKFKQYLNKM